MVCFETKEEANTAIQDLNETTAQPINISEQNKEHQGVNNIITTRTGKGRITGCREQERVITDQLCYGC